MRALIVPPTLNCTNAGDLAMMQVAVRRLRELRPGARVQMLTSAERALRTQCPDAEPVLYEKKWLDDDYLFGPVARNISGAAARGLAAGKSALLDRAPSLLPGAVNLRLKRGDDAAGFGEFLRAVREADLVVAAGAGGFNDLFSSYTVMFLNTMRLALAWNRRTAAFSQGLGPIEDPDLIKKARRVLPRLDLIALRERKRGPSLLNLLCVSPERVVVTGDDAVELAWENSREAPGTGIGVNVRIAAYAGVDEDAVATVRPVLHRLALAKGAALLGIPIAWKADADLLGIRRVLEGYPLGAPDGSDLQSPAQIIARIGECRFVVTGAYHAAVFALSQGIPAVCLAGSQYFGLKFEGLAEEFGEGCYVVPVDEPEFPSLLERSLEQAWNDAERLRTVLRTRAARQVTASRQAYRRFAGHQSNAVKTATS